MPKIFLKTENQIYQLSMGIPSPSPTITSLSTNIAHLHNVSYLCPLILCLIYSPLLSVSWHPLKKKIAPQCVVDQVVSPFCILPPPLYILYGTVYKLLSKCCPKKCFSAFAAYVVAILITHHHHHHNRKLECSPLFSKW